MKLALLFSAKPVKDKLFGKVRVSLGVWKVIVEGIHDSLLTLTFYDFLSKEKLRTMEASHGLIFHMNKEFFVQASFSQAGKEKYITVYLEKQ